MKTCTKCGEAKPTSDFGKHKATKDGLCSWCRSCHRKATSEWKAKNKAWQVSYNDVRRARYSSDPEFKAKCNESSAKTYHDVYKHDADYMGRMYAKKKDYVASNLDKYAAWTADYRQRKRSAAAITTELDALVIGEAYALAKTRTETTGIAWHVDHIVPLRGKEVCGLHNAFNLQVIPAVQNLQKGNTLSV